MSRNYLLDLLFLFLLFLLVLSLNSCKEARSNIEETKESWNPSDIPNETKSFVPGNTIETRYQVPEGFSRVEVNAFGSYLRKLKLKPEGSLVSYYNGEKKSMNGVYSGVVDLKIGNKDLHQCADAVMRLRADFLYNSKEYDKIHFNLTNGFRVDYSKWIEGYRVKVKGNTTSWVKQYEKSNTEKVYWDYLEFVFTYAGTLSLSKEMNPINIEEARIGDVFIKGGSPGHAVIIIDEAIDKIGKRAFLMAQSYMPAQEIQVLMNPGSQDSWYYLNPGQDVDTPEWMFSIDQLKRF